MAPKTKSGESKVGKKQTKIAVIGPPYCKAAPAASGPSWNATESVRKANAALAQWRRSTGTDPKISPCNGGKDAAAKALATATAGRMDLDPPGSYAATVATTPATTAPVSETKTCQAGSHVWTEKSFESFGST